MLRRAYLSLRARRETGARRPASFRQYSRRRPRGPCRRSESGRPLRPRHRFLQSGFRAGRYSRAQLRREAPTLTRKAMAPRLAASAAICQLWHCFPILDDALDVDDQRVRGHPRRFLEGVAGGDGAPNHSRLMRTCFLTFESDGWYVSVRVRHGHGCARYLATPAGWNTHSYTSFKPEK
jgi:hypothetical protein